MTREKVAVEYAGLIGLATAMLESVSMRLESKLYTPEEVAKTAKENAEEINLKFESILAEYSKP